MSASLRLTPRPFAPYPRTDLEELRGDGRWHLVASCTDTATALALVPPGTLCVAPGEGSPATLPDDWL